MASPTPNKGYTYPVHGGAVNAWDTPLNADFDAIDLNLGGSYPITFYSTVTAAPTFNSSYAIAPSTGAVVTLPTSIAQNLHYTLNGTIAANQSIVYPSGFGGIFIVTNDSSGSFTVTADSAGGGSGYAVAQGGSSILNSDGINIIQSDSNASDAAFHTTLGDPNGSLAGTAATVSGGPTDAAWDGTNLELYTCRVTGGSTTAVWAAVAGKLEPQGYLSVSADNNNPIITSDVTGSTVVNYVPFRGDWTLLSDGAAIYPYKFSAMTLTLTAAQAASVYTSGALTTASIYDIFMFWNAGTPVIGTGPSWTAGIGGSGTPGSCTRGTGAGGTAITRLNGFWVNAAAVTLTNGVSTYACPIQQGIYLGSILMDATAGQVTCQRSYGQSRRFAVWNAYNRESIILKVGDSSSWTASVNGAWEPSHNLPANSLVAFCGLPEEMVDITFDQNIEFSVNQTSGVFIGIGLNSVAAASGFTGSAKYGSASTYKGVLQAQYAAVPFIGASVITALEWGQTVTSFFGTEAQMLLQARWQG